MPSRFDQPANTSEQIMNKTENHASRVEKDSMGEMPVPADAYYGAQTARAVENFPISGLRFSRAFIRALGLVKQCAARTNVELGLLPAGLGAAIQCAAEEVATGKLDGEFVVDIFQTGSGTSTNMNANEVIANRAGEILSHKRGDKSVHPNDHVNLGQSSNDVIPTTIHLAALDRIENALLPALEELKAQLSQKAVAFEEVVKTGRTHLQDAVPMTLGQEFSGYASQIGHAIVRLQGLRNHLGELALGGTAVGTGINTHREFARRTIAHLAAATELPLREAENHFAAQAACDACIEASGVLRTVAVSLIKIANDIRLLSSGPRCGLGELHLPATQPGSSIMPGKVNPVMCEMVIQVGAQVTGNDAAISYAGAYGNFELNTMLPVIAHNLLQSIELLAQASHVFAQRCVAGIEADREKCAEYAHRSLALGTALAPEIGYDRAAQIVKAAYESGRSIREVAQELSGLPSDTLEDLLNPFHQVRRNKYKDNRDKNT
jgi:fumarate hydratase class II